LKPWEQKSYYLLFIFLTLLPVSIRAIDPGQPNTQKKYRGHQYGQEYLMVSAGAGMWSQSWQPGMERHNIPFSFMAEYGRTSFPVSIVAGEVTSNFIIDRFILNPNNFLAGLQYAPLRGKKVAEKFNIYLIGGLNVSYNRFTEEIYPGIVNYEYKVERKTGLGIAAAASAGYRIKAFEIKPVLFWFTGQSGFLAGHFSEQNFHTGSLQLHIMMSYRIIFNSKNTCPAFHKYKKI
jgi:hypothetical protein